MGRPAISSLATLVDISSEPVELAHVLDFYAQGTPDEEWIPAIASKGWIVVTADRGKRSSRGGEKLPMLCRQWRVTHAVMSAKIHAMKSIEKIRCLLEVWDDLVALQHAPRGSRHSIRLSSGGRAIIAMVDPGANAPE